jgi:hypothetical protein
LNDIAATQHEPGSTQGESILGLIELLTGNLSKKDFAKKLTKELMTIEPLTVHRSDAHLRAEVGFSETNRPPRNRSDSLQVRHHLGH